MNRVYVVHSTDEANAGVLAVVSTLEQASAAIRRECEGRRAHVVDVDGMSMPAVVRLDSGDDLWVSGWEIDGSPLEVTVPELHKLSRLLGVD